MNLVTIGQKPDVLRINLDNVEYCIDGPTQGKVSIKFISGNYLTLEGSNAEDFKSAWSDHTDVIFSEAD